MTIVAPGLRQLSGFLKVAARSSRHHVLTMRTMIGQVAGDTAVRWFVYLPVAAFGA
jgi:hypothetical protein